MEEGDDDGALVARSPEVTMGMRTILIGWLFEVHVQFDLLFQTFVAAVQYLDRYMARTTIERRKLQLCGIGALVIASKYEEIFAPEIRDFVYICDKAYTREEILATERDMCRVIDYRLDYDEPPAGALPVKQLATALYLMSRPSGSWKTRAARRTVRSLHMKLASGKLDWCVTRSRQRSRIDSFLKVLREERISKSILKKHCNIDM